MRQKITRNQEARARNKGGHCGNPGCKQRLSTRNRFKLRDHSTEIRFCPSYVCVDEFLKPLGLIVMSEDAVYRPKKKQSELIFTPGVPKNQPARGS